MRRYAPLYLRRYAAYYFWVAMRRHARTMFFRYARGRGSPSSAVKKVSTMPNKVMKLNAMRGLLCAGMRPNCYAPECCLHIFRRGAPVCTFLVLQIALTMKLLRVMYMCFAVSGWPALKGSAGERGSSTITEDRTRCSNAPFLLSDLVLTSALRLRLALKGLSQTRNCLVLKGSTKEQKKIDLYCTTLKPCLIIEK